MPLQHGELLFRSASRCTPCGRCSSAAPGAREWPRRAAGATLFAFAPLTVLVTYGWARARHLDRAWSTLAAAHGRDDSKRVLRRGRPGRGRRHGGYAAVAILAAGRWWTTLETSWLRLMAVAVGYGPFDQVDGGPPSSLRCSWSCCFAGSPSDDPVPVGDILPGATTTAMGLGGLGAGMLIASPWYIRTWA